MRILIVCGGSGINLLGQRQVLGMDAELQIDVSTQIVSRKWETQDARSFVLELDQNVGTTGLLFSEALARICEDSRDDCDKHIPEYVQNSLYQEPDIQHLRLLTRHFKANVALERGLAQSPAIGGLTIRHGANRQALEQVLHEMTAEQGLGPQNSLEVWLVSSTAGGTGEGIHRFVVAALAEFFQSRYTDTLLTVNLIRVGPLTYQAVNYERTALNTFFGIAADTAFALKSCDEFPALTTHWFYVDVPDVGTGEHSVPLRARNVEIAAKTIMLPELQDDLQRLLVYNNGIPMVLTRAGYWQRDFGEQRLYYETLRQLRDKLRDLVKPDYEQRFIDRAGQQPPRLESGRDLEEFIQRVSDVDYVAQKLEEGWTFPKYHLQSYPGSLEEVREQVLKWKTSLEELLGSDFVNLKAQWVIDRVREEAGEALREQIPLRSSVETVVEFGQEQWFHQVAEAHESLAWSRMLLGCDLQLGTPQRMGQENRLERLLNRAAEVSKVLHGFHLFKGGTARQAHGAAEKLGEFLRALVEVELLLRLEADALQVLNTELSGVQQVLELVESEFDVIFKSLNSPNYSEYLAEQQEKTLRFHEDVLTHWLERAKDKQGIQSHLEQGWRFPRFRTTNFFGDLEALSHQIAEWKRAIITLLDVSWDDLKVDFFFKDLIVVDGEEQHIEKPLRCSAIDADEWYKRIEKAHLIRAWSWHLLGCDLNTGLLDQDAMLLGNLLFQAREISKSLYRLFPFDDPQKKTKRLVDLLPDFISVLVRVDYLLHAEREAASLLKGELQEKGSAVVTLDLFESLDRLNQATWLQVLRTAMLRGKHNLFKQAVLRGAAGLSKAGLCYVLGLGEQSSVRDILDELACQTGQVVGLDGKQYEQSWWAGQSFSNIFSYEYRVLPPVDSTLRDALVAAKSNYSKAFRLVFTSALSEILVIAFSGASLTSDFGDTLTAPVKLLSPFLPVLRTALEKWDQRLAGKPIGQLMIVSAGVGQEPLCKEVLCALGLEDKDLEEIGQYYQYYMLD